MNYTMQPLIDEALEINAPLDQLGGAISEIPAAHAEVDAVLGQRKGGLESLQSLVGEAVRIHVFYRTLGKESEEESSSDCASGGGY